MATVQAYTKSGVDAKFNSRSNMTMVHNGGGSPDLSAYPDSKTGDVIERASDGARWAVVASTINPISGRVVSVAGKTGVVTLSPGDVGAAPASHTHTKSQITDLNASTSATANSIAQRGTGGVLVVGTPTTTTHATTKAYVDSQITGGITWGNLSGKPSTFAPSTHTHTVSQITDLTLSQTDTGGSVVQRDSSGRATVATPTLSGHATNKSYVDSEIRESKAWASITGKPSTFTPSTHEHTIGQVSGLTTRLNTLDVSAYKIDTATSNVSGSTSRAGFLLSLNGSGRLTAVDPEGSTDVANKKYVDSQISLENTWGNISGKPTTFSPSSHTHSKSQIADLNASTAATADSIAQRDTSGRLIVASPTSPVHATNKAYVDNAVSAANTTNKSYVDNAVTAAKAWNAITGKPSTFPPASHNHTMAQISDLPQIRSTSAANAIVQRDSAGQISTPLAPANTNSATSKYYVDGMFDSTLLGTENLNDVVAPGNYFQNASANITLENNYPAPSRPGHLQIMRHINYVKQEYTDYLSGAIYYRTKSGSTWRPWYSITQTEV